MFAPDIIFLRSFYATPLGAFARASITRALLQLWPEAPNESCLGVGYSARYLESCGEKASCLLVASPAAQGAFAWPQTANRVALVDEALLPYADASFNRVLLIHSVEHSEALRGLLQEVGRVLTPGGRMLAVVPNRLSLWSRASRSPFGYGRPFSPAQLRELLTAQHLTPMRTSSALFLPPLKWAWLWRFAARADAFGRACFPFFGGVLLMEAEKQVFGGIKQPVQARLVRRSMTSAVPQPV